jgi:hypothetical protein
MIHPKISINHPFFWGGARLGKIRKKCKFRKAIAKKDYFDAKNV